ncbi:hypothetical protein BDL97_05G123400 [Sphagnum fallax]|nr:hypothetical protein BDL97_05G123400 [Sphagnum fallax]KAH8962860.1 hypothetical protein BDL97_05G123400 [Sphagnum fallax]KAH8962861.1 hypothetical protein BDL97_05G123400 [Sphagnum fallax]KAH8962862.1 hypothetical protein BDL97_05G123400 [Sphagnum fallax]KAH8962863.1 hypothetical protein BDL97_05G123400 [Sphagnum fallax]
MGSQLNPDSPMTKPLPHVVATASQAAAEPLKPVFATPPPPPLLQDIPRTSVIFSPSNAMEAPDPIKKPEKGSATLVWRDVTVTTTGGGGCKRQVEAAPPTKVLKSSTGFARPGSMLSIMGSACSGKNILLKSLAGQLPNSAKLYGEIRLNGFQQPLPHGTYAYVRPEEELIESLTVREHLYYSALLQLPSRLPLSKKLSRVDACISEMDLEELVSIRIGCSHKTGGLSRFERKRLSLAVHMLSCPYLLFLEEPTYGLDSLAGVLMIATLRKLASTRQCTVIMTMQQATSHAWPLLDQLCLLSNGTTVYFGPSKGALEQFANAGFPCPRLQNPTDHFLGLIDTSLDHVNSVFRFGQDEESGDQMWSQNESSAVLRTLEATFQASSEAELVQSLVVQLSENEGPVLESTGHPGLLICISVLTWRSCVSMGREFGYYWLRLLLSAVLTLCIGTMYFNLGHSVDSVRGRTAAVFVTISFLGMLSIVGFPAMVKEVKIIYQEIAQRQTGVSKFIFANMLASIPFLLVLAFVCSSISYFLIGLHPMFTLFMYFVINIFMCFAIMDGLMMFIATILPKVFEGMVATLSIQILMLLLAGYFRLADDLPKPVWTYPISYLSFYTYSIQGLLQNEYVGVTFPSTIPKAPPISAQVTLQNAFQAPDTMLGKWVNVLILAVMAIGYRVLVSVSFLLFQAVTLYKHKSLRRSQDE